MKYTKDYIINLDEKSLDFAKRWLWDALTRSKMTELNAKTKAKREYAHVFNHGLEFAVDMIRTLKRYQKNGDIANEITLFDDNVKPDEITL